MASTKYEVGRSFEYRVKKVLEKKGYFVLRSPASKGSADLVALKKGEVILVQCKLAGRIPWIEKMRLMELANSLGAKAVMAFKSKAGLAIEVLTK